MMFIVSDATNGCEHCFPKSVRLTISLYDGNSPIPGGGGGGGAPLLVEDKKELGKDDGIGGAGGAAGTFSVSAMLLQKILIVWLLSSGQKLVDSLVSEDNPSFLQKRKRSVPEKVNKASFLT